MSNSVAEVLLDFLKDVSTVLEKVPESSFDLRSWVRHNPGGCGTVACAIGWCIQDETFMNKWGVGMEAAAPILETGTETYYGFSALIASIEKKSNPSSVRGSIVHNTLIYLFHDKYYKSFRDQGYLMSELSAVKWRLSCVIEVISNLIKLGPEDGQYGKVFSQPMSYGFASLEQDLDSIFNIQYPTPSKEKLT